MCSPCNVGMSVETLAPFRIDYYVDEPLKGILSYPTTFFNLTASIIVCRLVQSDCSDGRAVLLLYGHRQARGNQSPAPYRLQRDHKSDIYYKSRYV